MKYPNRAQTPEVAARNGRKGKKRSPWSQGPMVNNSRNERRQQEWRDG